MMPKPSAGCHIYIPGSRHLFLPPRVGADIRRTRRPNRLLLASGGGARVPGRNPVSPLRRLNGLPSVGHDDGRPLRRSGSGAPIGPNAKEISLMSTQPPSIAASFHRPVPDAERRLVRILHRVVFAALATGILAMSPAGAGAAGVVWQNMTLEQALAAADQQGKLVLIDFHAGHCGACGQLDNDVWETADGVAITEGMIPLSADTGTPEGGSLCIRLAVTGLPAVVVLRPDGSEVDRVVGYTQGRNRFIEQIRELQTGIDPLPGMEEMLKAHPDSVSLCMPVFERYLNRQQVADAKVLMEKIFRLDPANARGQSERALMLMAKYQTGIAGDQKQGLQYWQMIMDRWPSSGMSGAAIDGSFKAAAALGQIPTWKEWVFNLLAKQPANGRLQYSVAMVASHNGLVDPRFAKAARTARSLGIGGAFLDTVAVKLEGGSIPPNPSPAGSAPKGR
jgi:hypothetical protein